MKCRWACARWCRCDRQAGWFTNWYLLHDPFTFIIFWVYVTCATASVNRAPFDLAEAESELVAGFHTEYSGLRWSFFFMAEYGSMLAVSLLAAILFLGGWNGPVPVASWLGWTYDHGVVYGHLGNVLGTLNILFKGVAGVAVMMWARWTLPRLRIDQVITTCLKYCVPIAAVMFLGATWWQYKMPGRTFFGLLSVPQSAYQLRENWPETSASTSTEELAGVTGFADQDTLTLTLSQRERGPKRP
jgi:NADH-quinone oxidoreductase subunit H